MTLLTACRADVDVEQLSNTSDSVRVVMRIEVNQPVPTGVMADQVNIVGLDNELINRWTVVFVHAAGSLNGKIASVISRDPKMQDPVQSETFETKLPAGTYDIYSFANLTPAEIGAHYMKPLTEGSVFDAARMRAATILYLPNRKYTTNLPMSGYQRETFTSSQSARLAIEVVRIPAKMQFFFTNRTTDDFEVLDYRFLPTLRHSRLIGTQERREGTNYPLNLPVTDTVSFRAGLSKSEQLTIAPAAQYVTSPAMAFYMSESVMSTDLHPTGNYIVQVSVRRTHGTDTITEDWRYAALPNTNLKWICRNDYILQPIKFIDYVLEPEVMFYPPIGGYPEAEVENEQYGQECYVRFRADMDAEFAIYPRLRDTSMPYGWIYMTDPLVTAFSITVNDTTDHIFTTAPSYNASTGEILGTLSGNTGTAKVTMSATIDGLILQRVLTIQNTK